MTTSPFPGMDPYLEAPEIWHSLHTRLITNFADLLNPQLAPKYIADLQTDIVIEELEPDHHTNGDGDEKDGTGLKIPDVMVMTQHDAGGIYAPAADVATATQLTIAPLRLHLPTKAERRLTQVRILYQPNQKLVAVIELLSPVNKRPGKQRRAYLEKRSRYIDAHVHLIEIDLLRRWERMPLAEDAPACDYMILVSNAYEWPDVDVWALTVRNPLPIIPVPLLRGDPPAMLDIGDALRTAYSRARYDLRIDYNKPAKPPLSPQDAAWAKTLIH